ncbi:MAG: ATP-binding protein [Candidatus Delongbacteria bacterium]
MIDELHVLIVDDEPGMRGGAQRALRLARAALPEDGGEVGFACETAGSVGEARARLEQGGVDLLLLDYKLPDGTGLDVLEWLKSQPHPPLTVMITAYASLEMAVSTTKSGAWDFLAKPFTPEELRAVAQKAAQRILLERRARELAEEKRRVRFQFISVLAHELKAPLAVLESYLDLIQRRTMGPELATYDPFLGRSLERIHGMRKLIFDLLDLTRIESGQKQRDLQPTDLAVLARGALEAVKPQADERGITLTLEGPESLPLTADTGELEILFNNLLSNAVKYNREGGSVALRLFEEGPVLRIEVQDTGIGMSEAEVGRLFGEFVRIKNEHTRHISGSGLGLSILKRLCALYSGDVTVTSAAGVGSTFTVTLARGL